MSDDVVTLKEAQREIHERMASMKAELKALGEKLFKQSAEIFFQQFPEVESFRWTQYTPYFNDGEPCVFSVHDWYTVNLTNGDQLEDVYYSEYLNRRNAEAGNEPDLETRVANTLHDLLGEVDEDTMLALFGDHAQVIVSRNGIDVEEYDHD